MTKNLWVLLIPALLVGCEAQQGVRETAVSGSGAQPTPVEAPPVPGGRKKSKKKKKKKATPPPVVYDATKLLPSLLSSSCLAQAGATDDLANRAMELIRGVTAIAQTKTEPQAMLDALKAYVDGKAEESKVVGVRLRGLKRAMQKSRRERYRTLAAARFKDDVKAYQSALAGFELAANEAQINELNALLRTLADPMQRD